MIATARRRTGRTGREPIEGRGRSTVDSSLLIRSYRYRWQPSAHLWPPGGANISLGMRGSRPCSSFRRSMGWGRCRPRERRCARSPRTRPAQRAETNGTCGPATRAPRTTPTSRASSRWCPVLGSSRGSGREPGLGPDQGQARAQVLRRCRRPQRRPISFGSFCAINTAFADASLNVVHVGDIFLLRIVQTSPLYGK
jgi:hypothetical protein